MPTIEVETFETLGAEFEENLGESASGRRKFAIRFAKTPEEAYNAFVDYALANYTFFLGIPARRFKLTESTEHGNVLYTAEVEYKFDKNDDKNTETDEEGNENEFTLPTFSMRGGEKKIVRPIKLVARQTVNDTEGQIGAVDYQFIGWDPGAGEFKGTTVEAPDLTFMVPSLIKTRLVNFDFVTKLTWSVGSVNEEKFYGLEKGECLYLGLEQSYKVLQTGKDEDGNPIYERYVELQHHFRCAPNLKDVKIGGVGPFELIRGWDYIDVHYKKEFRDVSVNLGPVHQVEIAVPEQVDIWQVRPYIDFKEVLFTVEDPEEGGG